MTSVFEGQQRLSQESAPILSPPRGSSSLYSPKKAIRVWYSLSPGKCLHHHVFSPLLSSFAITMIPPFSFRRGGYPPVLRMEKDPPWEWVGDLLHIKHFVLENLLLVPFLHGYLTILGSPKLSNFFWKKTLQTSPPQCGLFMHVESPHWGGEVCTYLGHCTHVD